MANVSGIAIKSLIFSQYVTAGLITPETLQVNISTPAIPLAQFQYLTTGTGAGALDLIYGASLTLASTTQTLDLTSLTALDGSAVNFARVREFFVLNPDPVAGHDLIVEQGASNGWTQIGTTKCYANGGTIWQSDPNSTGGGNGMVTAGGSKTVKFDSGAHTINFYVFMLGTSVA